MEKVLLDLGTQPLVNNLCRNRNESINVEQYPLKAIYDDSLRINLDTEIDPKILYKNYLYRSGINIPYIKHCEGIYKSFQHLKSDVIIDIGGNDGTLLKTFKRLSERSSYGNFKTSKRYINVDASNTCKDINLKNGLEYKQGFFNENLDLPKADIITSTNVFQHTKDIDSFLKGIVKFLNGVWILEFPYTLEILQTLQFDQFYHEHYFYWLLTPIEKIFKKYGLKIINISQNNMHGGSLRIWITNKYPSSPSVDNVIDEYKKKEREINLTTFDSDVKKYIKTAKEYILNLSGKTVFFGAAAKGAVFLNALSLNVNNMPNAYVVDDTISKQGFFLPGTGFEIFSRKKLISDDVKNIIILAHNFKDHIAKSLRSNIKDNENFKGNIISMLPKIETKL